jgi:hypothetical protein
MSHPTTDPADLVGAETLDRFGFEPEVTARLAHAGARVWEIGISYSRRTYAEGKKIGWRDGAAAIWHIIRFNLFAPALPRPDHEPVSTPASEPAAR